MPDLADLVTDDGVLVDSERLAEIWLDAALTGFAHIFPPEAPKPELTDLRTLMEAVLADPNTLVRVARLGRPLGFVVVGREPSVPTGWLLSRLYVDPRWWGRGIGGRLHEAAMSAAAALGAPAINLWVLEHNERARRMYERRGWHLVEGRRLVGAVGEVSDVLYEKRL